MINEYIRIEVGMLFIVDKTLTVKENHPGDVFLEERKISKGSIIEIRYPFAWNFRRECNTYCNASEEAIRKNCSFYGKVFDHINFENKHNTKQIISEGLFNKPCDFNLSLKISGR